ncbi:MULTISPECIES: DoxX family protein [Mycetocola]|uniref:DoxX family protein n=1 Tax=Mycetocola TaxID=76634 RepID=UPI0005BD1858|nr:MULTISPECIES: DoxX family protein [Mycetocola]MCS4276534.1 putative oxidoreductase [Mycetocola sp. BIGb0189]
MTPSTTSSLGLALLRVALGVVFFAHGWQKLTEFTLAGTTEAFRGMGVPLPELVGPAVAILEIVGGAALILGLATRIVAGLLVLDMLGALFLVHASAGIFVDAGGFELVLALAAGAAALALTGPGTFSADHLVRGLRRGRSSAATA